MTSVEIEGLIDRVNELMSQIDPHVAYYKPIPFLGVVWRPLSNDEELGTNVRFSKADDTEIYWFDCAWKWDYSYFYSEELPQERFKEILEKTVKVLEANVELLTLLRDPKGVETNG